MSFPQFHGLIPHYLSYLGTVQYFKVLHAWMRSEVLILEYIKNVKDLLLPVIEVQERVELSHLLDSVALGHIHGFFYKLM